MKNILITTLLALVLLAADQASANDLWKNGEEYKLISFAGNFICPIKVNYTLDSSEKLVAVEVVPEDKSQCDLFDISLSYSTSIRSSYAKNIDSIERTITIHWINPGSDAIISSKLKVTTYEENIASKKCLSGGSEITNRGTYPCAWGMLECSINPGGLSNEYLTIR
jgi:hypothetical protein